MYLSMKENIDMIKLLLEKNKSFNFSDSNFSNLSIINARDKWGATSFLLACELGKIKSATILLNNGANVNDVKTSCGSTGFIFACIYYDLDLAKLLLENGADTTKKNKEKKTGFMYAEEFKFYNLIHYLKTHNP